MDAKNKKPIPLDELDWNQFIKLQNDEDEEGPLIKIPFSINTPYLQKNFNLDLIIWNLSNDNMEMVKKVVHYVLKNFDKLFETGWTLLYYYTCEMEVYPDVANHTLSEFYNEQIDFESPYYEIQLEINGKHLTNGIARYCFVVSTGVSTEWILSDDDMRMYMVDNKCKAFDTNNDDMQMLYDNISLLYGDEQWDELFSNGYKRMESEGFQYAEHFQEFEYLPA